MDQDNFDTIDVNDAVNWDSPLCSGLKFWYLRGPWNDGGSAPFDLVKKQRLNRVGMALPPTGTSGPGRTTRQRWYGQDNYDGVDDGTVVPETLTLSTAGLLGMWFTSRNYVSASHVMIGHTSNIYSIVAFLSTNTSCFFRTDIVGDAHIFATPALAINTWYHLMLWIDAALLPHLYIDGVECPQTTGGSITSSATFNVIGSYTTASLGWAGALDDVILKTGQFRAPVGVYEDGRAGHPSMLQRVRTKQQQPQVVTPVGSGQSMYPLYRRRQR